MDYGLLGFFLSWMRAYMQWQNLEQRLSLVLDGPAAIKGTQGMDFHAVKPSEGSSESLKPRRSSTESCNCGGGRWLCLALLL